MYKGQCHSVTDSFAKDWSTKMGVRSVNVTAEN